MHDHLAAHQPGSTLTWQNITTGQSNTIWFTHISRKKGQNHTQDGRMPTPNHVKVGSTSVQTS